MKKIIAVLVLMTLAVTICASAFAEMTVGGWEIFPAQSARLTEENEPEPMPDEALEAFEKATEGLDGEDYVPVALLATQVVAGTNYCILAQVTPVVPNPVPKWALVYVYADLEGNAQLLNVYEIYIDRHVYPEEDAE